jgi:hypothetical protein
VVAHKTAHQTYVYKEVDDGTGREERGVQIFPPPKKKDPIAILVGFGLCRDRFFFKCGDKRSVKFFCPPVPEMVGLVMLAHM